MMPARPIAALGALLLGAALLGGCASTGPAAARDPLEPMNRAVFAFNEKADQILLKPAAQVYTTVIPEGLRGVIGNMFSNLTDVWTAANQLLQGKPAEAMSDLARFTINTTLGVAGMADVATTFGLEKHREDFGQTLGRWGVPSGPYLVLPLLGPSSFRDGTGYIADFFADPLRQIPNHGQRNSLTATRIIDTRAGLFPAERLLDGASLDRYGFLRDGYLQRRRSQVYDGDPPPSKED